eukprot:TRINITY_DN3333_c0_g1_i1.p1 TRINITY_DN3333_c0_g1~~TRINITY_DN3333_c0_g1_i1.p1  ORF type:complete len:1413 (-),score=426.56 TRINITY_DN3333_c0_g1_i1:107-4300(-)
MQRLFVSRNLLGTANALTTTSSRVFAQRFSSAALGSRSGLAVSSSTLLNSSRLRSTSESSNRTSMLTLKSSFNSIEDASALCTAAAKGDLVNLKALLSKGANVNSADYDKRTALHVAAAEGQSEICEFLIKSGANVNSMDRWGNTPIENAARGKHESVLKLLTKAGGFALPHHDHETVSALCTAASEGDLARVTLLVNAGADLNKGDYDHRTALHLAAAEGRLDVVQYLVNAGADVNSVDRFGNTPLNDAKRGGHLTIVRFLQEKGAILEKDLWRFRNTPEFQSSLQKSLPLLSERGGWIYAETWLPSEDGKELIAADPWWAGRDYVNKFTGFRQQAQNISLSKTSNLAVRAFNEKKPILFDSWSNDDLQRSEAAKSLGVASGLTLPIVVDQKVLAVLFFVSANVKQPKADELESFSSFARGLISSGISKQPKFEAAAHSEQMNTVFSMIVEEGVFNSNLIYEEVDWFFNNLQLQQYYFERFSPQTIAKHLHSYIAAKKLAQTTGRPEDIWLTMEQKDGSECFYLCPSDHTSFVTIERKVEKMIERLPPNKAYTLTFFQSKGTAIPNGQKHLGLYIFDTCDYISPVDKVLETETDIWKIATGVFLRDKTPAIRDRYQEIIKEAFTKLSPILRVFPTYRDGTIPIMLAFKKGAQSTYLQKLTEILKFNGLTCERKFIETFANGLVVYSLYLHPPNDMKKINEVLDEVSLLYTVPTTALTPLFLAGAYSAEQYAYASAVARFIYYFMNKPSEDFAMLAKAFKDDPLNMSRLNGLQNKLRREAVSFNRILDTIPKYSEIIVELFNDFTAIAHRGEKPSLNKDLLSRIKKAVDNELDEQILVAIATFNAHLLKTNFYRQRKSALSFRLSPDFLKLGNFPEIPFGLFFVMGSDFHGFHLRFRDVARGGIRIIRSANPAVYNRNLESLFSENYGLAYTQNKKNKDIPEFGSKGTVLLNPDPAAQNNPYISFQKYVSGLLDLLQKDPNVVDHYGKDEILFLGPDEGTADFMKWAAEYAKKRGYKFWKAFTTGKPRSLGGVPHDTYGMTTRSVHRYVVGCLQKKNLAEETVTKLQTGGPDGDLGSNEILLSKDKTIAIVDGSGVVYDPNGVDRRELTRLAKDRVMINHFKPEALGKGGFRILTSERDVKLPNGDFVESGLAFRNEFHLNPLSTADLFVPCGGRPESVNLSNVHKLFHPDGTPRFKIIVEGANLFFTNDARMVLEQAGVILYKDASANKGGVTSSSLEVLAALAMNDTEFSQHMQVLDPQNIPEFYNKYVKEIQERIEENAALEFECIWKEHEQTKIPRHVLTDKVSDKINSLNDLIQDSSLWNNLNMRSKVLAEAIPRTLIDLLGLETILKRVPENYVRAIFGAYLASRYVYQHGLNANEFAFFEFMQNYLKNTQ